MQRRKNMSWGMICAAVLIGTGLVTGAHATTIGPDAGGYRASNEVPYSFEDISTTGTNLRLADDGSDVGVDIGFTFNFYGTDFTTFGVSNNGLITFGGTTGQYSNETVDSGPAGLGAIAPLWDDWIPHRSGAGVYYTTLGTPGQQRLIVQWNLEDHSFSTPSTATFEATLYEGSNNIKFNYSDVYTENLNWDNGASATVGIRNSDGSASLLWSYDSAIISDGEAIEFTTGSFGGTAVPTPSAVYGGAGLLALIGLLKLRRPKARMS